MSLYHLGELKFLSFLCTNNTQDKGLQLRGFFYGHQEDQQEDQHHHLLGIVGGRRSKGSTEGVGESTLQRMYTII